MSTQTRDQIAAWMARAELQAWVDGFQSNEPEVYAADVHLPREVWEMTFASHEEAAIELASRGTQMVKSAARRIKKSTADELRALEYLINPEDWKPDAFKIPEIISSLVACIARHASDGVASRLRLNTAQAMEVEQIVHESVFNRLVDEEVLNEITAIGGEDFAPNDGGGLCNLCAHHPARLENGEDAA